MSRILVADDEDQFRSLVREILTDEDFEVFEASNGLDAVEIFQNNLFDAVLLDLRMPALDGIETMQQLKARDPRVPIIILTAFGDIPKAVEAVKQGAYDFLTKPPEFERLITVLKNAAEMHKLKRASLPDLSEREKEILKWLKEGKSSYDIAGILRISSNTVNFHIKNLTRKLDVVNRVQAVSEAIRMGIIADS